MVSQKGSHCPGQHNWRGRLQDTYIFYPETCLGIFYGFVILQLTFVHSCCYIAWLVSSVFGAYRPVSILGSRSPHLPGDLMAKVRNDCVHFSVFKSSACWWEHEAVMLSLIPSIGLQSRRHQAGGPVWCWESRDPPCVSNAEPCNLHALDGGGGGEQVCMRLRDQAGGTKGIWFSTMMWMFGLYVLQYPQLLLQLRGRIQTFSSQTTNTPQEVTLALITDCIDYISKATLGLIESHLSKLLCVPSYSTTSKIFRWVSVLMRDSLVQH